MQPIKNIIPKELVDGITGYYAHGTNMTFGYIEIKKGTEMAEHNHMHEQITYIIEGQLDMVVGGKSYSLTAGMYYIIPSNVSHGAFAVTDCKVIDVFNPTREDYRI